MKIQSYKNISERFHLIIILSCKYTSFSLKPTFLVPKYIVSHYNLDMIIALGYRLLMKELAE